MVMWHTEHTLETSADPGDVWRRLAEVATWPDWDAGLSWAELAGPFSSGSRGRLRMRGEGTRAFRLSGVEAFTSFTALVHLPLAEIRHSHVQEASAMGTRMTQRIEIAGPLSWLYGLTRGRSLRAALAPSMRSLARIASEPKS